MACSLETIKKDSIKLAVDAFMEGNPNMEKVSDTEVFVAGNIELNKPGNFNKFIAQAINNLKAKVKAKFGDKFTEGWVKFIESDDNLNRSYKFTFPSNLEEAYKKKLGIPGEQGKFFQLNEKGINPLLESSIEKSLQPELISVFLTPNTFLDKLTKYGFTKEEILYLVEPLTKNPSLWIEAPNVNNLISYRVAEQMKFSQTETSNKANEELDKIMKDFLKDLNITVEEYDNLKEKTGLNVLGVANILEKTIDLAKNRKIDTLPEEAAHFYVELLAKRNTEDNLTEYRLYKDLMSKIESWEKFEDIKRAYMPKYNDLEMVKKEAIAKAIAEAIVTRFESKNDLLKKAIIDFLEWIKSVFKTDKNFSVRVLSDDIATKMLSKDYSDIAKDLDKAAILTDYKDVDKDTLDLINKFSKIGAYLTGSIALRKQGTIYRTKDELFHDLDFKIPIENKEKFLKDLKDLFPEIEMRKEFDAKSSYTTLWKLNYNGKEYDIDFFFSKTKFPLTKDNMVHWKDTFQAKIDMGRTKDVTDLINFIPFKEPVEEQKKKFLRFFQLEEPTPTIKPGVQELFESNQGFKEFVGKEEKAEKPVEDVSDNNIIDENYLLLTEQERKQFNKLQKEGLISKGLFNENKDIVYTTKNRNGLIQRLKELAIDWIKIENLNNWVKVTIDTLSSQKPEVSKKVDSENTENELINKIKSIADRLGIKIERLDVIYNKQQEINTLTKKLETASDIEKEQIQKQIDNLKEFGVKKEALALADLLNSTIQLTTEDNLALISEEVLHFLVDIVQQKNPELYKELLQKVKTYAKYQELLNKYSKEIESGEYTLEDLQKETIAQVLVDYLIKDETNENEYQNNKSQKFWEKIQNWASSFFNSIKNKDYDVFDKFVRDIINSDYLSEEDRKYFKNGKYYYSLAPNRDELRTTILEEKAKIGKTIVNNIERYTYEGKVVPQRVSDLVEKFYNFAFRDRQFIKKAIDSIALERGTLIHKSFENTFAKYVDPKTGEILKTPIESNQELKNFEKQYPEHAKNIDNYVKSIIKEYPDGYFLTEIPIINKKKTLAGTIDLVVLDKNGKVHVYDWKTKKATKYITKTKSLEDITEIPWYNKKAWVLQLDNYSDILVNNYNLSISQIGRLRAIPILIKQTEDGKITSLEMAPFDKNAINVKERAKIPVISEKEVTGKKAIDEILKSLRAIKEDLQKRINKRQGKVNVLKDDLEHIDNLITDLVVAESLDSVFLNISSLLSNIADYFKDKATIKPGILIHDSISDGGDKVFNDFQDSLKNKSKEELGNMLVEIEKLKKSLLIYRGLDKGSSILEKLMSVILYNNPNISEEIRKKISSLDTSIANGITNLQTVKNIVVKEFGTRYNVEDVQSPDKEGSIITWIVDAVSSVYHQRTKVGKLVGEVFRRVDSEIREKNKKTAEKFEELREKKKKLLDINVSQVFKRIIREVEVTIDGEKQKLFKLIPKIDPGYYKEHEETLEKFTNGLNNNLKFFNSNEYSEIVKWIDENIDVPRWKAFFDEKRKEYEAYIKTLAVKQQIDFPDEYVKRKMEQFDIKNDIYKSPQAFKKLGGARFIKEDKWESKEFKELKKDPIDLEIYNYFKYLNQKAIALGYLDNQGEATFIPFEARATDIAKSPISYFKNYVFDKYSDDIYTDVKIDPLTGQEELAFKRPYTTETIIGKKVSQQLDLFRVFEKFEQALNQYETLKKNEDLIYTIAELEAEKTKEISVSLTGKLVGEKAKESTSDYERIKKLINYRLYGKKFKKDIEFSTPFGKISLLKGLNMLDSYASQLFLGFYHKIAIGAYIGSSAIALSKKTKGYKKRSLLLSMINPTEAEFFGIRKNAIGVKKAFDYRINSIEKEEVDLKRTNTIKNLAVLGWKYAANTLQLVDEKIQDDLFFAALRSHYVINNKIVNVEDLKEQLYPDYYSDPSKYDKDFKKYIQDKPTLKDWISNNIKNGKLDLSTIDKESLFDFNQLIKGTSKEIIGNMSSEDYSYMRIGLFANIVSKFKVWVPGVVKNFYANLHYNRETKTTSVGSFNALVKLIGGSLYNLVSAKDLTRKEATKMSIMLFIPFLQNRNSSTVRNYMRNKYKLYVEEGKEKGFLVEMSEKQFIDAYLEKSKSLINNAAIGGLFLLLLNSIGGDDDDDVVLDYLKQGIKKGIGEIFGISTPWEATKFFTKTSLPQLGALDEATDPLAELLTLGQKDKIWLEFLKIFVSEGEALETAEKAAAKETTFTGKLTRETLDAIPYVRQINRNIIVPYNEEYQEFLGVDKNYKVR